MSEPLRVQARDDIILLSSPSLDPLAQQPVGVVAERLALVVPGGRSIVPCTIVAE